MNRFVATSKEKVLFLNGDDLDSHAVLENRTKINYTRLIGDSKRLIIDEAQEIPEIGKKLKLIVDTIPGIKVIITGSSSFDLHQKAGEPLVGRMNTLYMYSLAQLEFSLHENLLQTHENQEQCLIYGSYPELSQIRLLAGKKNYVKELINAYLLKDILAYEGIKKREKIIGLLQKIAYRNGS